LLTFTVIFQQVWIWRLRHGALYADPSRVSDQLPLRADTGKSAMYNP
jgi:hypothetical protein